jgi:hypothetical protein
MTEDWPDYAGTLVFSLGADKVDINLPFINNYHSDIVIHATATFQQANHTLFKSKQQSR